MQKVAAVVLCIIFNLVVSVVINAQTTTEKTIAWDYCSYYGEYP